MKKLLFLATALFAAVSCSEEVQDGSVATPSTKENVSITVTVPQTTRVAIDSDYKVTWAEGDDVSLLSLDGEYSREQLTIGTIAADGESANFTGSTTSAAESFRLIHPYSASDTFEEKTIDEVSFPSYICTIDTQDAGFTKTYMVSSEAIGSIADVEGVTMSHVGAVVTLNTTFENAENLIGAYELTSVVITSPDNRYYYKQRVNLGEDGVVISNYTKGSTTITVGQTVAASMSFGFNVLPFSLTADEALTFTYSFTHATSGNVVSYTSTLTAGADGIDIARATYNTINLTVDVDGLGYVADTDYSVGDLLDGGIIYDIADDGSYAMVFSLGQAFCSLALVTAQFEGIDYLYETGLATSSTDGAANTTAIIGSTNYSEENFPAVAWCVALGDGWYLPAANELISLLTAVGNVGVTITDPVADDTACTEGLNATISAAITANDGEQFITNLYYYPSGLSAAAKANLQEIQTDSSSAVVNIHQYKGAIANPRYVRAVKKVSLVD